MSTIYFNNRDDIYEHISPEGIDRFWEVFNTVYPSTHRLHVDTTDMLLDDKLDIAWRMLDYPFVEDRLITD